MHNSTSCRSCIVIIYAIKYCFSDSTEAQKWAQQGQSSVGYLEVRLSLRMLLKTSPQTKMCLGESRARPGSCISRGPECEPRPAGPPRGVMRLHSGSPPCCISHLTLGAPFQAHSGGWQNVPCELVGTRPSFSCWMPGGDQAQLPEATHNTEVCFLPGRQENTSVTSPVTMEEAL